MSCRELLRALRPGRPILDLDLGILSAPVRHLFMIGTIWHLAVRCGRRSLRVLEIGSWCGASALSWAQGLAVHAGGTGSITCVDVWAPFFRGGPDAETACGRAMDGLLDSGAAYELFLHNIGTLPPGIVAQHIRGTSESALPVLRDAWFDVVFVDADHAYASVVADLTSSRRLVADGGVLCGDDLNVQWHECDTAFAIAHSGHDLARDPATGRNFHPGVTRAVGELFGPVSSWAGFWAVQRHGSDWRRFSLADMPIVFPDHFPPDAVARAREHLRDLGPIA
jgi:hypothetical protein